LNTHYTVSGAGNPAGGSITTITGPPSATEILTIERNVPYTQLTHYVPNDPFPAASHEMALDKLTMEIQQLVTFTQNLVQFPPNAPPGMNTVLPYPVPGDVLGWDSAGTAITNYDVVDSFNGRSGDVTLTGSDITNAGGALVSSSVASFNGRTGAVTLTNADISGAGGALTSNTVASFNGRTGTVTLSSADIFGAGGELHSNTVNTFNTRIGAVTLTTGDVIEAGGAPLASPIFTGVPAGPTAAPGTNTTQLASTAFVTAAVTASTTGVASFNTRTGAVALNATDVSNASGLLTTGGTMTGALVVNSTLQVAGTAGGAWPEIILNKSASGIATMLTVNTAGVIRWRIVPGSAEAEGGTANGSNFGIDRFDNSGNYLGTPLTINRASGQVTMPGGIVGNTSGTAAPGGIIGEIVSSTFQATTLVNGAWTSINGTGIGLQAGDWDIWAVGRISLAGGCATMGIGVTTALNGPPVVQASTYTASTTNNLGAAIMASPQLAQNTSSITTWYANVYISGATSPVVNLGDGAIYARRRR
jgi:hypothetical protein